MVVRDVRPDLLPWERRVIRSMVTANTARVGAVVLRVVAGVVAVASIVGELLYVLSIDDRATSSSISPIDDVGTPAKLKWSVFLQGIASPLAFAGLVLAASFLVAVYAARLDLDIVQSDDEEFEREQRAVWYRAADVRPPRSTRAPPGTSTRRGLRTVTAAAMMDHDVHAQPVSSRVDGCVGRDGPGRVQRLIGERR